MGDKPAEEAEADTAAAPPPVTETLQEPEPTKQDESERQAEVSSHIGNLHNLLSRRDSNIRSSLALSGENSTSPKAEEVGAITAPATKAKEIESQNDYIEWEEPMEDVEQTTTHNSTEFRLRKFMLSGLEQHLRSSCCSAIKSLGGEVSELNHYDASATHVVCSNPAHNEKILSSMAADKWIVHVSYVQASGEASKFVDEELYEFGNPKSAPNLSKFVETIPIIESMYWWRIRALEQGYGAFHAMYALVFSKNKPKQVRLIEPGGGAAAVSASGLSSISSLSFFTTDSICSGFLSSNNQLQACLLTSDHG